MIRIGILGDMGSGKSFVARSFGYPVFNADLEVSKLYKRSKKVFIKLRNKLPKYIKTFPINKTEVTKAILSQDNNINKIVSIIHQEVRKQMYLFLKKNKNKKIVILDIPLLLENKINKKKDILIFIDSKKIEIEKRLKKRPNFNRKLFNKFKKIQFKSSYKKKNSHYVIKNNFTKKNIKRDINNILSKIL